MGVSCARKDPVMWCRTCQQDVPAIPSHDGGAAVCCARCGEPFELATGMYVGTEAGADARPCELPSSSHPGCEQPERAEEATDLDACIPELPAWDDTALEDDLLRVERIVQRLRDAGATRRVDPPVDPSLGVGGWHVGRVPETSPGRGPVWTFLSWSAVALGLAAFVCGGVLLTLSWSSGRPALWSIGLPTMLTGQILILLGMLGLLETIWERQRRAQRASPAAGIRIDGTASNAGQAFPPIHSMPGYDQTSPILGDHTRSV